MVETVRASGATSVVKLANRVSRAHRGEFRRGARGRVGRDRHRGPRVDRAGEVRLDRPVRPHAHQDGPKPVQHIVGPIRLSRDLPGCGESAPPTGDPRRAPPGLPWRLLRPAVVPAGDRKARRAGGQGRHRPLCGGCGGLAQRTLWTNASTVLDSVKVMRGRTCFDARRRRLERCSRTDHDPQAEEQPHPAADRSCPVLQNVPSVWMRLQPTGISIEQQHAPPPSLDRLLS